MKFVAYTPGLKTYSNSGYCFSETWLHDYSTNGNLQIPGHSFISRAKSTGIHGGVDLYIRHDIQFNNLHHLHRKECEALRVRLRPKKLPPFICEEENIYFLQSCYYESMKLSCHTYNSRNCRCCQGLPEGCNLPWDPS
jgi:hypothetical protein